MTSNYKKQVHPGDLLTEEQKNVLKNKGNKIEKIQSEIMSLSRPSLHPEASWSKHVTPNTLAVFQDEQSWSKVDKMDIKTKVKEFKSISGISWSSIKDDLNLDSEDDGSLSESESSETTPFDAKDMDILGSMPMEEEAVVVKCNNCQRPLLPSRFKEHAETCLGDRLLAVKSKKTSLDEDELDSNKRKQIDLGRNEEETKTFKKQKRGSKEKASLDLDRQCGVIQAPNNTPCTRAITCKSHSMGAKRAVKGRSQTYDILLAAYQKRIIGRPIGQEPLPKKKVVENDNVQTVTENSLKNLKKLQNQVRLATVSSNESSIRNRLQNTINPISEEVCADSDEEIETVMQAILSTKPLPLAEKPYFYVKRKRQCFRMKNTLLDAITPKVKSENSLRHNHSLHNLRN